MATLPGAWRYRVSAGTGWPSVSILWLCEMENFICNFYLSVAADKIVWADLSLRYTSMLLGRWASNQQTNWHVLEFQSSTQWLWMHLGVGLPGENHWCSAQENVTYLLLMSCTTPHHTTDFNPEPQDPCSANYLRYYEGSESFSSILCLLVKIDKQELEISWDILKEVSFSSILYLLEKIDM